MSLSLIGKEEQMMDGSNGALHHLFAIKKCN
jgi:hypothetical protein